MLNSSAPRYVALCGAPKAGKNAVADLLIDRYGGHLIDDGAPLRHAAMALYGLSHDDVYTQAGKAREIQVCGKTFTVRQLLGDLGNLLEGFYGEQFMPERAISQIEHNPRIPFYIFSSVRKTQGLTYLKHGGIVVEVKRPGFEPVHDFDHYDKSLVGYTIDNDGGPDDWKERLEGRVISLFDPFFGGH